MPWCGKTMDRKRNQRMRRGKTSCYSCGRNLTVAEVESFVASYPFKMCDACAAGRCKHCGNAACTFHHPICAEALYEHEQARRHGMPPSGRHG